MGNQQSKNDDFSKNPNFNMQQHQQAMQQLQANYTHSNYNIDGIRNLHNVKVQETEFKSVHRTGSISQPINIHQEGNNLKIQFQYDSDRGSKLVIFIGVTKVEQNQQNKITQYINSELTYEQMLEAGKKVKFQKSYPLKHFNKVNGSYTILQIKSLDQDQRTQYSIKNVGGNNWKLLLQKFELNGRVTELHNIYKGGHEGQDCIICFCAPVTTLIEPCMHLCLCSDCSESVRRSNNACPICRTNIQTYKKIKSTESA